MKISKHALCSLVKIIIHYNSIKVVLNIHLSICITYVTVLTSTLSVRLNYLKDTCISFSISIKDKPAAKDKKGLGGSVSQVVGLPKNSYKPITNTALVRPRLFKLQKGCTRLTAASDKAYQLLAHGRWLSGWSFFHHYNWSP